MVALGSGRSSDSRTGVALLGSTGSIGRQAIDVLTAPSAAGYDVVALAGGQDIATLNEQVRRLGPRAVAIADPARFSEVELPDGCQRVAGPDALTDLVLREDVDVVVVATGGIVSLRPVLAALEVGKVVATANKETLVSAGHLVMPTARRRAAEVAAADPGSPLASALAWLRPIDSEQSAIWQCLVGEDPAAMARLILTASGGPFRTWSPARLADARPEDALAHPTWAMGAKITVDSATLMNKGLEVIEAHWLYDVAYDHIDVVIHPQSLVHSLVEFVDGSQKAQLGLPDMRIPIQYALTFPRRISGPAPRLDLTEHPLMSFSRPDESRFPALAIAREAGRSGPGATTALIAADDIAVERFLAGSVSFTGIARLVGSAVERFGMPGTPTLDDVEEIDAEVRRWARRADVASGQAG